MVSCLEYSAQLCLYVCTACRSNEFRCVSNGMCISTCQLCDGYSQCGDYSDEHDCTFNNSKSSLTCLKMSYYFISSPVCVTRGHPYKLFVRRTVVNTRKHYLRVGVIEPWNNLNCATVDFSSLRRFECFLRRTDLSPYLKHYV